MADIPSGQVTTADLFRELRTISDAVIRLEERVALIPDHEVRLRALERFRFTSVGIATAIATVAGVASSLLAGKIH